VSAQVLITGGAGFIGSHLADRLLRSGQPVLLLDNLSRASAANNVDFLRKRHGARVEVLLADVRDPHAMREAVRRASFVYHFAAQVAVTTSLVDPYFDFDVNVRGTLNLLEALRGMVRPPPLLSASTNKVYGALSDLTFERRGDRYEPLDELARDYGISEAQPLDFQSPYGCSKGAADQYVLDYARSFGLEAVVFRMSCIYGPRQLGTEDQGWIAHFLSRAIRREPITLFGDGLQVRDTLFIDDLVDAFLLARRDIRRASGKAFNIGGGAESKLSLIELVELIAELEGRRPSTSLAPWRPGDQRYYVSDCRAFKHLTGWAPRVALPDGVSALHRWLLAAHEQPTGQQTAVEPAESTTPATPERPTSDTTEVIS
jgi:CDP-paratose 2-epimerase